MASMRCAQPTDHRKMRKYAFGFDARRAWKKTRKTESWTAKRWNSISIPISRETDISVWRYERTQLYPIRQINMALFSSRERKVQRRKKSVTYIRRTKTSRETKRKAKKERMKTHKMNGIARFQCERIQKYTLECKANTCILAGELVKHFRKLPWMARMPRRCFAHSRSAFASQQLAHTYINPY